MISFIFIYILYVTGLRLNTADVRAVKLSRAQIFRSVDIRNPGNPPSVKWAPVASDKVHKSPYITSFRHSRRRKNPWKQNIRLKVLQICLIIALKATHKNGHVHIICTTVPFQFPLCTAIRQSLPAFSFRSLHWKHQRRWWSCYRVMFTTTRVRSATFLCIVRATEVERGNMWVCKRQRLRLFSHILTIQWW